jgi:hypothetical protein
MSEILPYLAMAVSLVAIGCFFWAVGWIRGRLSRWQGGSDGGDIYELLQTRGDRAVQIEAALASLAERQQESERSLTESIEQLRRAIAQTNDGLQHYGAGALRHSLVHTYTVGERGPQSAVVVLLDDRGDGVLLDVLSGQNIRVYARAVRGWHAEHVSQEGEKALREAREAAAHE